VDTVYIIWFKIIKKTMAVVDATKLIYTMTEYEYCGKLIIIIIIRFVKRQNVRRLPWR